MDFSWIFRDVACAVLQRHRHYPAHTVSMPATIYRRQQRDGCLRERIIAKRCSERQPPDKFTKIVRCVAMTRNSRFHQPTIAYHSTVRSCTAESAHPSAARLALQEEPSTAKHRLESLACSLACASPWENPGDSVEMTISVTASAR